MKHSKGMNHSNRILLIIGILSTGVCVVGFIAGQSIATAVPGFICGVALIHGYFDKSNEKGCKQAGLEVSDDQ